jgi:hypothetical protein
MSQEKLDELAQLIAEFQAKLCLFEVPARERGVLAILGDLLTNVDIASRDIYWAKKELAEDNIYELMEKRK